MSKLLLAFSFLIIAFACHSPNDKSQKIASEKKDSGISTSDFKNLKLVGLPCPGSVTKEGSWSYEEAEKRKDEIFNLVPTRKDHEWTNPTSGGAVHINSHDEIEIYKSTVGILKRDSAGANYRFPTPNDTSIVVKPGEIWINVSGFGFGNAASVLITSEIDLQKSEAIKEILKELWRPGVQIYYLVNRE